ncbi:MAG: metal ABC transporter substrate-binding protein [Brevinema sp.]
MKKQSLLLLFFLFSFCVQKNTSPRIVTGIAPIAMLIQEISDISTTNIIPSNTDPHTFQLKPSDALMLSQADLIVVLDDHIDGYLFRSEKAQYLLAYDQESHEHPNPHVWVSYVHLQELADKVLEILIQQYPDTRLLFIENHRQFTQELGESFQRVLNIRQKIKRPLYAVQRHCVWNYLLEELDIELLDTLEESEGVSLKKVTTVIDKIKSLNSSKNIILIDDAFSHSSSTLVHISEETGLGVLPFNPMISPDGRIISLLESNSILLLEYFQ